MKASAEKEQAHVEAVLEVLKGGISNVLGERLIGIYLYGSLVSGDFLDGVSDIDLLAVTHGNISDSDLAGLEAMHQQLVVDHPAWENRVEVAYVPADALRTFRERTSPIGIVSPGEPLHRIEAGRDWLMNWYLVRQSDHALLGPSSRELIPPVSREEFLTASREQAAWLIARPERLRDHAGQSYIVLTLCRALYTREHGEQASKPCAATWVRQRMPEWADLIEDALRWRTGFRDPEVTPEQTLPATQRFIGAAANKLGVDNQG